MSAPTAGAAATSSPPPPVNDDPRGDMAGRCLRHLTEVLIDFGDEILDTVRERKKIDVEDVRQAVLDPLRDALRRVIDQQ